MLKVITRVAKSLQRKYRLWQYDDFTIADYFRAQGARIGEDCRILIRDLGSEPYLIRIGNHCTIAGGVAFVTHDGATWVFTEQIPHLQKFGTIEILDNCFIGVNAILMPNIRIGPDAIVGAGAVVTKDVPPGTVVAGCPARPISTLEAYKRKALLAWQQQQPPGYLANLREGVRYSAAEIQAQKQRSFALLRDHLSRVLWAPATRRLDGGRFTGTGKSDMAGEEKTVSRIQ
jgi:acetyltransferase-like isoleucine patch superfamily enzyme